MFEPVPNRPDFPQQELSVGRWWKERQIYEKSLQRRAGAPPFVFFEGPPTANGMPHPGHCLTRAIKDLFPRYRTMRGYRCERKGGWDTHGLPVEVEVCKQLGIHTKEEIEAFGVEKFIHLCQESVWRYMQQWERLTERIGFWIHLDQAYVTYHQSYVESVWWSLANLFNRGLLYQGHKIVWWWAQGGTALSSGEVGQGYREVADPSVFVRCPLVDQPETSLLVWTTTPWTLPSNQFVAVRPDLSYSTVRDPESGQRLIVATALVDAISQKIKRELEPVCQCPGADLVGRRYRPPFDYYYRAAGDAVGTLRSGEKEALAWRVVAADFVTTDSGTGLVHQAPAFGEVDFDVLKQEQQRFVPGAGPELICAVGPDGRFTAEAGDYEGRWVKAADKDITRELRDRGLLLHQEQYIHDYPFCWRAEQDPLIQYPRQSWFVRTTQFKDAMLRNNRQIRWLPEHIRDGRFGNFLESNVDWALSRERYWGTPLPIWVCEQTGHMEAVASYDQLLAKPDVQGVEVWEEAKAAMPNLPDDLKVHKPYIDAVTYQSPQAANARMRRVPEVIDCWYDSGAMPFAQWGYPHRGGEQFADQFPADFISEALDQTRGWFYSQLAISTLLFSGNGEEGRNPAQSDPDRPAVDYPHPFRNCIVLGLMLAEWWEDLKTKERYLTEEEAKQKAAGKIAHRVGKMSKQLRNYPPPQEIFDTHGADALRWYFFANQAPWNSIIYSEQAIKDSIPEFLLRLWNVYSFLVIYAGIDRFDPSAQIQGDADQLTADVLARAETFRPVDERGELDRWILSELHRMLATVIERMDAYDNYPACQRINDFVDALSNWYVRRSRDRFWAADKQAPEKLDAYWTLYECLLVLSKAIAPFVPFLAETMWRNLAGSGFASQVTQSVHLCDYPQPDEALIDTELSERMGLMREVTSLGRRARMDASLKVRQPLSKVEVILAESRHEAWLAQHSDLIAEELNVKQVEFARQADQYIDYSVLPDFKRLGPRIGKQLPAVKKALAQADAAALLASLESEGKVTLDLPEGPLELDQQDVQVRITAKPGWAAAQGAGCVVVLSTELNDDLIREGLAREVVRVIQDRRKSLGCEFTDRISIGLETEADQLREAVEQFRDYVTGETLANALDFAPVAKAEALETKAAGYPLVLYVAVLKA